MLKTHKNLRYENSLTIDNVMISSFHDFVQTRIERLALTLQAFEIQRYESRRLSIAKLLRFNGTIVLFLRNGLSINKILDFLEKETADPELKSVYFRLHQSLQQGETIGRAFENMSIKFPDFYQRIMFLCEEIGDLRRCLNLLTKYYENAEKNKKHFFAQIRYPLILLLLTFVLTLIILLLVMPMFSELYLLAGDELPFISKILLWNSNALLNYSETVVTVGSVIFLVLLYPTESRKNPLSILRHKFLSRYHRIKDPIIFCQSMSVLLESGMPLIVALRVAEETLSPQSRTHIRALTEAIKQGLIFKQALTLSDWFPKIISVMLVPAEESGNLSDGFRLSYEYLSDYWQSKIETCIFYLNPILLGIVGVIITLLMFAIYLPIFNLATLG